MAAIFDPVPFIRPARNGETIWPIASLQSPHFGGHVKRLIVTTVGAVHLAAILRNRVTYVPTQIRLSRASMATIWQNVTLALGLKGVFHVASAFGITGQSIAILADTGATCL
jgi:predicted aspartyl protease